MAIPAFIKITSAVLAVIAGEPHSKFLASIAWESEPGASTTEMSDHPTK